MLPQTIICIKAKKKMDREKMAKKKEREKEMKKSRHEAKLCNVTF